MHMRYLRQNMITNLNGTKGLKTLFNSRVAIIGTGAMGTHIAEMLCRSGIGKLTLIDNDKIEISNLPRQTLFTEKHIGKYKVTCAAKMLRNINSDCAIVPVKKRITKRNSLNSLKNHNLIIDATDNYEARYVINEAIHKLKIPAIFNGVGEFYGQTFAVIPFKTPCYNCFLPESSFKLLKKPVEFGIHVATVANIASIAVVLALKILLNKKFEPRIIGFDIWNQKLLSFNLNKRDDCPICSLGRDK